MGAVALPVDLPPTGVCVVQAQFEYHRPSSLPQACGLLRKLGPDAIPLAGGTDVLVDLRRGSKQPRHLVSLADLHELRGIRVDGGELKIGALVTPSQLERSEAVLSHRPELLDAVGVFGTPQVRRRATVGGSLCTAASCGDLAPLLMALGARVVVVGPEERQVLSLEDFFGDHRKTVLESGHILSEVTVSTRSPGEGAAYEAFGLRATNFITVAGVAAFLRVEEGLCTRARIALGAVAPTPLLTSTAQEALVGGSLDDKSMKKAASLARQAAAPISDIRGSADHRRELVEELCFKALEAARERAQ